MSKVALITGVSRNIGKSICVKFIEQGYRVIGTYNTSEDSAKELMQKFPQLDLFQVDFCSTGQTSEFIEKMKKYQFDVIVNNAGTMNCTDDGDIVHEYRDFVIEDFESVMRCNFYAPLRICIELQDNINEGGSIINIASTDGMQATYASLSYSASKAALINLTASLSNSVYSKNKIRINSVSPGWIMADEDGGMGSDENSAGGKAGVLAPIGRNGKTQEIANIVYALTTNDLFLINGTNIVADGGFSNHDVIYFEEATGVSMLRDISEIKKDMESKG